MTDTIPTDTMQTREERWPVLTIDYELFEHLLEHCDASDEEKRQFIEACWNIIVSFVDLGFGIHPMQQACELPKDIATVDLMDVLGLKETKPCREFAQAVTQGENA